MSSGKPPFFWPRRRNPLRIPRSFNRSINRSNRSARRFLYIRVCAQDGIAFSFVPRINTDRGRAARREPEPVTVDERSGGVDRIGVLPRLAWRSAIRSLIAMSHANSPSQVLRPGWGCLHLIDRKSMFHRPHRGQRAGSWSLSWLTSHRMAWIGKDRKFKQDESSLRTAWTFSPQDAGLGLGFPDNGRVSLHNS